MKDAYNRAVADVLARTEYGTRVETPETSAWMAGWSNSSRNWAISYYKIKRGQPITLDANEILIYTATKGEAQKIASHLPALPLDALSHEAKERGPEQFLSNPKSPEEEWINLPESSEGVHEHGDPTHSPYEGDIPPWGQQGYGGSFPMAEKVYYVNAYAVVEYKTGISFMENLQKYGTYHSVGVFPQHLTSADFDYYPFAAIPVRREEGVNPSYFFKYLERMAPKVPLQFLKIVIENEFPKGLQYTVYDPEVGRQVVTDIRGKVKLPDDRYFEYTMLRPFKHPRVGYVNAYVENRLYGGPEEGGWWYNAGSPVAAIPFIINGEFTSQKMAQHLENTIGYHSKYPLSSVLGHDTLSIVTENAFPEEYPSETPHYE